MTSFIAPYRLSQLLKLLNQNSSQLLFDYKQVLERRRKHVIINTEVCCYHLFMKISPYILQLAGIDRFIMKLEFSNKKDRKNCQFFIRAVKQIEKHNPKDTQRPLYLTIAPQDIRIAPTLQDLHRQRIEAVCLVLIKNDVYTAEVEQEQQGKIYLIQSFKMLRAFKKNQARITLIELRKTPEGLTMYFQTENKQVMCQIQVQCEEVPSPWPEHPESQIEPNYELIPIGKASDTELSALTIPDQKQELWLQVWAGGILFRTVKGGKYRLQSKLPFGNETGFNFTTLKAKLKSNLFLNVKGEFFLDHLYETFKKKRTVTLFIKLINDPYQQNQIRYAYLILKTPTDFGFVEKAISCFLCHQMGEAGEQAIRLELQKEKQVRQSSLLKREDGGVEEVRRIVVNRLAEINQDNRHAEGAIRQCKPLGKIQEGQETFTRRFKTKY